MTSDHHNQSSPQTHIPDYRSLFETNQDGLIYWEKAEDDAFQVGGINQATCDIFKYTMDEIKSVVQNHAHVTEASLESWLSIHLPALLSDGIIKNCDFEGVKKDGSVFPMQTTFWTVKSDDGELSTIWAQIRDVTEERQRDEKLRILENGIENMPIAFAVSDGTDMRDGTLRYVNKAFEAASGQNRRELENTSTARFAERYDSRSKEFYETIASDGGVRKSVVAGRDADGKRYVRDLYIADASDPSQRQNQFVTVGIDVTDQADNENMLGILYRAIEQADIAVGVFTSNAFEQRHVSFANPAWATLLGISLEDSLGMSGEDLMDYTVLSPDTLAKIAQAEELKQPVSYHSQFNRPDGSVVDCEVRLAPVTDENENVTSWVTMAKDVTEHHRLLDELNLFRRVIEQTTTAITINTVTEEQDSVIQFVNKAAETLTGVSQDSVGLPSKLLSERGANSSDIAAEMKSARTRSIAHNFTDEFRLADGRWRSQSVLYTPIRDEDSQITHWVSFSNDITEQVKAQQELHLFRRVIDQAPLSVAIAEISDGQISKNIYVNKHFEQSTKLQSKDFVGRPVTDYQSEDVKTALRLAAADGRPFEFEIEVEYVHAEGETTYREVRYSPVLTEDGAPSHAAAFSRDITDRRRAEKDRILLQAAMDHSPAAMILAEVNNRNERVLKYINPAFETMFGYSLSELQKSAIDPFKISDYKNNGAALTHSEAIESGTSASLVTTGTHKNGKAFIRDYEIAPARDLGGNINGWVGVSRDITSKINVHEAARRTSVMLQQLSEAYFYSNQDGYIVDCNPAAEVILGRDRTTIVGSKVGDFVIQATVDDGKNAHTSRKEDSSGNLIGRSEMFRGDGANVLLEWTATPFKTRSGESNGWITIARDVTKQIELESQLRQAQKMEAVGQLTGGIAHDFNNLMGIISGSLQLIQEEHEDWDFVHNMASRADRATLRGKGLVDRLLAFSRRQALKPGNVDVRALIKEVFHLLSPSLNKRVSLEVDLQEDILRCRVDRTQLETALINLALNAKDAMPDGGRILFSAAYTPHAPEAAPDIEVAGH